jgi:hypothetical protein
MSGAAPAEAAAGAEVGAGDTAPGSAAGTAAASLRRRHGRFGQWQGIGLDDIAGFQNQGALDHVFQLAHIARPGMGAQPGFGTGGKSCRPICRRRKMRQCLARQGHDVVRPLAQRGDFERKNVEAVEQVFAEPSGLDFGGHVPVGGGQNADVERHRLLAADPLHFTLLQHPQQFGLQTQRHFGNFVEQQRAAIGLLEFTRLRNVWAPVNAPFFVTEQGGFQQVVGNCRAVDGNEGALARADCSWM